MEFDLLMMVIFTNVSYSYVKRKERDGDYKNEL
jgi:hypothetical protein